MRTGFPAEFHKAARQFISAESYCRHWWPQSLRQDCSVCRHSTRQSSERIERAFGTACSNLQYVGLDHGRTDIGVPKSSCTVPQFEGYSAGSGCAHGAGQAGELNKKTGVATLPTSICLCKNTAYFHKSMKKKIFYEK
jgi:hypothetical protein